MVRTSTELIMLPSLARSRALTTCGGGPAGAPPAAAAGGGAAVAGRSTPILLIHSNTDTTIPVDHYHRLEQDVADVLLVGLEGQRLGHPSFRKKLRRFDSLDLFQILARHAQVLDFHVEMQLPNCLDSRIRLCPHTGPKQPAFVVLVEQQVLAPARRRVRRRR